MQAGNDRWRNWLNRRFLPCLMLRYETDIDQLPEYAAPLRFGSRAGRVICVPATPLIAGLVKQDRIKAAADSSRLIRLAFPGRLVAQGLEKRASGVPSLRPALPSAALPLLNPG